jgi:chemotaxis protein MotB
MSGPNDKEAAHEIIIVKRRGGGHDDGHHGGVWKIAFADFMTAMMAFFLVLWIVNSTSKETRSSIARYFNPVKLADTTPARKGLRDAKESDFDAAVQGEGSAEEGEDAEASGGKANPKTETKDAGKGKAEAKDAGKDKAKAEKDAKGKDAKDAKAKDSHDKPKDPPKDAKDAKDKDKDKDKAPPQPAAPKPRATRLRPGVEGPPTDRAAIFDEAQIAEDPQHVLDEIAGPSSGVAPIAAAKPRVFRDPFEALDAKLTPRSRPEGGPPPAAAGEAPNLHPGPALATPNDPIAGKTRDSTPDAAMPDGGKLEAAKLDAAKPENAKKDTAKTAALEAAGQLLPPPPAVRQSPDLAKTEPPKPGAKPEPGKAQDAAAADKLASDLKKALSDVFGRGVAPGAEVTRVDDGLLVSLTDKEAFEMFAIGSSEPHPKVVKLLERIAAALAQTPGQVVLRGHTDARAFRRGNSDNWRLSASRAHVAYHMLLRGGFDATRLDRVEGMADRALRVPANPLAAENRRIEILVRPPASEAKR